LDAEVNSASSNQTTRERERQGDKGERERTREKEGESVQGKRVSEIDNRKCER